MLKFKNYNKDLFVQETALLSATHGGPIIKKRRLFSAASPKHTIFFIMGIIRNKFKVIIS